MVILSQKGDIQKDDTFLLSMTLVLLILCSELFLRVVTLCLTTHIHLSLSTVCIPQTYPEYTLQIFQDVYKNALGHCWKNCHKIGTTRFSYFTLKKPILFFFFSFVVFSLSVVSDSLWPHGLHAAHQASQSIISRSLLKLMYIESVMPSNHLILCLPLLLLLSIFPSIRVFSSESVLRIRWPKY